MYSLDQVIYFLEQRQQTEDWNIREVAIEYLKAYRDDRDELTALRAFWKEQQENDPLTWDELKQMEGMPVWVEHNLFKGWRFVGWQANEHMMVLVGPYSEQLPLFVDGRCTDWQAYRKERK